MQIQASVPPDFHCPHLTQVRLSPVWRQCSAWMPCTDKCVCWETTIPSASYRSNLSQVIMSHNPTPAQIGLIHTQVFHSSFYFPQNLMSPLVLFIFPLYVPRKVLIPAV